ncbi:hypothetical protein MS3_00002188 [Schistosoma haematobium]|uniref:Uncharacterized protein n=1 Tax=Schistosoma haematobium TaxID=6185 RepID=A0A922S7B2_SCHHA|nr:hypothetical protein MS3_00002188 [Schistosoma haematobium]KAH9596540.1 hypothetical protein MS3_00002188 [Schistosoma haematobium]
MKIYELAAYAIQAEHGLKEIPQGFDVDTIPGGMRVLPQLTKPIVRRIKNQLEQIMINAKMVYVLDLIIKVFLYSRMVAVSMCLNGHLSKTFIQKKRIWF